MSTHRKKVQKSHRNLIHNHPKLESAHISIKRKVVAVYLFGDIVYSSRINKLLSLATVSMSVKNTRLKQMKPDTKGYMMV